MLAAPTFAAASDWHQNSWHPTSGGGCDWTCQQGGGESVIVNGQVNLGPVWSKVNAAVANTAADVNVTASSVGNTAEIVTMNDTFVDNTQVDKGDVGATVNATVDSAAGYVNLDAAAACNSVDVSTDPNVTAVNSRQTCAMADPEATVNATVSNAGGVGMTATAVGNQLTTDSNAAHFPVNSFQQNSGAIVANVNASVTNVGAVDLSAAAVGNSAQIVHFDTGGH
jgi:hypothetical protein